MQFGQKSYQLFSLRRMKPEMLLSLLETVRNSLYVIYQFLEPTAYRWPLPASVKNGSRFDYIIVGAGTAGCILANRLTEDDSVSVLLIEAGGPPPLESVLPGLFLYLPHTVHDWNLTSTNDNYTYQNTRTKSANLTIGRMLGGTGGLHHLMHVRGHPQDYNDWAELLQDDSWNYENILPYLKKPEKLLAKDVLESPNGQFYGTDGELLLSKEHHDISDKFLAAFEEVGVPSVVDLNGLNVIGFTEPVLTIGNGTRQSSAEAFLRPIKDRPNLHVLMNTEVTKVIFDHNNNALGVIAVGEDENELVFYANNEVILSAGGLNTPKLLMLSGVGRKEILDRFDIKLVSDLPVGLNLMDHPGVVLAHKMGPSNAPNLPKNPRTFGPPAILGAASYKNSKSYPDYQTTSLIFNPNSDEIFILCDVLFCLEVKFCETLRQANENNLIFITYLALLHPESRGNVEIGSLDPKVPPIVDLGQFSDEDDLNNIAESVMHFLKVKDSSLFKNVSAETVDFKFEGCKCLEGLEYWKCYSLNIGSTLWHYSGTAALSSVIDNEMKVRGVNKLRVVDGSVIPIINTGNLNSPIMGIAEKAADLIKKARNVDMIKC